MPLQSILNSLVGAYENESTLVWCPSCRFYGSRFDDINNLLYLDGSLSYEKSLDVVAVSDWVGPSVCVVYFTGSISSDVRRD